MEDEPLTPPALTPPNLPTPQSPNISSTSSLSILASTLGVNASEVGEWMRSCAWVCAVEPALLGGLVAVHDAGSG